MFLQLCRLQVTLNGGDQWRVPIGRFSNLRLVREQIIADGRFLAARNTFSGEFTNVFTASPIGPLEPTGEYVEWEVINTFRYDDDERPAEEWVQTDYRSFLTKLGVTATQSAERRTNTS